MDQPRLAFLEDTRQFWQARTSRVLTLEDAPGRRERDGFLRYAAALGGSRIIQCRQGDNNRWGA